MEMGKREDLYLESLREGHGTFWANLYVTKGTCSHIETRQSIVDLREMKEHYDKVRLPGG